MDRCVDIVINGCRDISYVVSSAKTVKAVGGLEGSSSQIGRVKSVQSSDVEAASDLLCKSVCKCLESIDPCFIGSAQELIRYTCLINEFDRADHYGSSGSSSSRLRATFADDGSLGIKVKNKFCDAVERDRLLRGQLRKRAVASDLAEHLSSDLCREICRCIKCRCRHFSPPY